MTGCMSGQTDEQAEYESIGPGKPGQKRVSGHSQRRSGSQFEDARRYSRQNAWILPPRALHWYAKNPTELSGEGHMGNVGLSIRR